MEILGGIITSIMGLVVALVALLITNRQITLQKLEYKKNLAQSSITHFHTVYSEYLCLDSFKYDMMELIIAQVEGKYKDKIFTKGQAHAILKDFEGISYLWKTKVVSNELINSYFGLYLTMMNNHPKIVNMINMKIDEKYVFPNLIELLKLYPNQKN
ncbi:MAG: hypothetical protein R1F52_06030 [Candidatus Nitrosoabyssus spongiisocia]|nr:MAG: hypothetical protein R1F52_06030 [Nitrosopumilaceae archaeon AB1(1)]